MVDCTARSGCTVIVPFREEMAKRHLKLAGDLGRVVFNVLFPCKQILEQTLLMLAGNGSQEYSVDRGKRPAFRHCLQLDWPRLSNQVSTSTPVYFAFLTFRRNFDLHDVHVEGTERIVEAVAKYDVDRYVHVSSYNANPDSESVFFRTKGQGEQVARKIYPETTIVRPAPMFGYEDRLLNRLASAGNMITSNWMQERFWPVHSIDVGMALESMIHDDTTAAETYELYGPTNYSMAEIAALVDREIIKHRRHINIPPRLMKPLATYLNKLIWWTTTSEDHVVREFMDQEIDPTAKTFKDLGIEPVDLKSLTFDYLKGYRSSSYYDLPPMTEREKREEKKYLHVIDDQ
jgi:NADH dehydrogenase (ubiquinone) 1 alpha subcomplex subunit 9